MKAEEKIKLNKILEGVDENKLTVFVKTALEEVGETLKKPLEELTKEEKLGVLLYLIDKYPRLYRLLMTETENLEYFTIPDWLSRGLREGAKAILGGNDKPQQPSTTIILPPSQPTPPPPSQSAEIPGWVWVAGVAIMFLFVVVIMLAVLKK